MSAPLSPRTLTERQAFDAMRVFLEAFWLRGGADVESELASLLSWTQIAADGITMDPAQWNDWRDAVTSALQADDAAVGNPNED